MDQDTYNKGREIRSAVLGKAYVAQAVENADDFSAPLQDLVTEYCWGAVWGRDGLSLKTRSMLNLAMIAVLNRPHELRTHVKGAIKTVSRVTRFAKSSCRWPSTAGYQPRSTVSGSRARRSTSSSKARSRQMDIGFIGLGNMGFPIAARLVAAGNRVVVFDTRSAVVASAVQGGAEGAESAKEVADRVTTVMASLPSPQASMDVAQTVASGNCVRRFIDLSTVGSHAARRNHALLAEGGVAALDSPVSGGVHGAESGTLTVMVSGPRAEFDACATAFDSIGRATFVSERPGAAQTMKLVNNLIAATSLAATAEVMVMGVKAGLDAQVMIDVLNAGSGATHASREKFPRAVLPRTFDYGFATGLMVKDVRLYLDEAKALGMPTPIADAVAQLWETTLAEEGPESDFTSVVKPIEAAAGVVVGEKSRP